VTAPADLVISASLTPGDAHQVFRAVLDALSRPGSVTRLPAGPLGAVPATLLPVLALADLGTGVCVLDEDGRWGEAVAVATNAPTVDLGEAKLVAAVRPVTTADLGALARGSAAAPEDGALACVPVTDLDGGAAVWRLSGPGVPGGTAIAAPVGLPDGFAVARAGAVAHFPAGIDLLLVAPDGRVVGLPRSTTLAEED
jgi:alpha-D-ribose 1-methylphosphonate 5-triphosphate synthase subunit PhnH